MSSKPLAGKVALITGGSKGIGKAAALRLAKDGANVVINYASDAGAGEEVVAQIGHELGLEIKADAGSIPGVDTLIKETIDRFGKIDILIANAAASPDLDLQSTTEDAFDKIINVNIKGPYFLCQVGLFRRYSLQKD